MCLEETSCECDCDCHCGCRRSCGCGCCVRGCGCGCGWESERCFRSGAELTRCSSIAVVHCICTGASVGISRAECSVRAGTGAACIALLGAPRWNWNGVVSVYRVNLSHAFARRTFCASSRLMDAEGGVWRKLENGEGGVGGRPFCNADGGTPFLSMSVSLLQHDDSYTAEEAEEPGDGGPARASC